MSNKPLPIFETDDEAQTFVESADLTQYDLSGGTPLRYEVLPAVMADVSLKLPQPLLDAVKSQAHREGVPYQRFILHALESALNR